MPAGGNIMQHKTEIEIAVISMLMIFLYGLSTFGAEDQSAIFNSENRYNKHNTFDTNEHSSDFAPWAFSFQLNPSLTMPAEKQNTFITSGMGFDGDAILVLDDRFALRLSVGRSGLRVDDDVVAAYYTPAVRPPVDRFRIIDKKFDMSALRYFISGQYYWYPQNRSPGAVMYSIHTGIGGVSHYIDYEIYIIDDSTGQIYDNIVDTTLTYLAFTFGADATVFLSRRVGVNLGIGFDLIPVFEEGCMDCFSWTDRLTAYDATMNLRLGMITIF
jgi:hypothetical protein